MKRIVFAVAAALALAVGTAHAAVPSPHQRSVWQQVCAAKDGTLTDQPALVCLHEGVPSWSLQTRARFERVCEQALGGSFVFRVTDRAELAACFVE